MSRLFRIHMATYNLTRKQKGVSGQRIVSNNSGNDAELEKRVSSIENKLDTILTLLNKEANNDKDRPKPVSGDDSGV
jgi:hypothetical protein